jgi:hypothetical protein
MKKACLGSKKIQEIIRELNLYGMPGCGIRYRGIDNPISN